MTQEKMNLYRQKRGCFCITETKKLNGHRNQFQLCVTGKTHWNLTTEADSDH